MARIPARTAAARVQVSRAKPVARPPAILRAQEELRTTRDQLDQARQALLEAAQGGKSSSLRDIVQTVEDSTELDPGMIQHALWILVHERALMLDDDLDVTRAVAD
jgi:hypothetical protein